MFKADIFIKGYETIQIPFYLQIIKLVHTNNEKDIVNIYPVLVYGYIKQYQMNIQNKHIFTCCLCY
jgi:hypothetical protein